MDQGKRMSYNTCLWDNRNIQDSRSGGIGLKPSLLASKPSLAVQQHVKRLVEAGLSTMQLARNVNLSKSAAARWEKRFREASQARQRGVRKRKLSIFEAMMLVRRINQRCDSLAAAAERYFKAYYGAKVSPQNTAKDLLRAGLRCRQKRKKPYLNKRRRKQCMAFALKYQE